MFFDDPLPVVARDATVTTAIAVTISIVTNALLKFRSRHESARKLTWDLHREFESHEMRRMRFAAGRSLEDKDVYSMNVKQLYNSKERRHQESAIYIFDVISFYERLWLAYEDEALDTKLADKLFGEIFYWWWIHIFEKGVCGIEEWPTMGEHLQKLNNSIASRADAETDMRWRNLAVLGAPLNSTGEGCSGAGDFIAEMGQEAS